LLGIGPELLARTDLRVSPQIIAHSALLELSSDELEAQVEEEAERNPALQVVRRHEVGTPWSGPAPVGAGDDEGLRDLSSWLPAPCSARDDILWQFRVVAPHDLVEVGEVIVSALDDHGYLRGELAELADVGGASLDVAERALFVLQRLDPPGLGARTLAECLLLQLECRQGDDEAGEAPPPGTREFIAQCLDAGPREMQRCARQLLHLTDAQIAEILDFIRTHLHPYPASLVRAESRAHRAGLASQMALVPPAVPDVALELRDGRVYVIVPVSERVQLRIDSVYQRIDDQLRHRRRLGSQERTVRERVRAARELIRLLQRRQETLALVAETIIQHQHQYFATGDPLRLCPLDQKDIARATGLHESTVCRAVKGKHVLMPDGALLPFDVFFDDALPAKVELHRLISQEPAGRPYSDQELAVLLAERGYDLARRTVTKYRLQLGLSSAHKRRREAISRRAELRGGGAGVRDAAAVA